jgi:hypothetical protein
MFPILILTEGPGFRKLAEASTSSNMASSSPLAPPTTPQSGPQKVKGHFVSPVPYHTTRQTHSPSTPTHQLSSSVPPSPYAGLTEKQIKKLQKAFEKTDSKIEFSRELLEMFGIDIPKENVVGLVAKWADEKPDVRTFSRLTTHDHNLLCKSIHNDVNVNYDLLHKIIPDSLISPHFLPMLRISRLVSSRNTEMGTRKIINLFLDVAVYIARIVFNEERLVIHHEWETEPTEVPEIGVVSGPLDYVTSRAAGKIDMGPQLSFVFSNIN